MIAAEKHLSTVKVCHFHQGHSEQTLDCVQEREILERTIEIKFMIQDPLIVCLSDVGSLKLRFSHENALHFKLYTGQKLVA